MKKEIKIILIGLLAGFFITACNERGPVELRDEDDSFEVELLTPEPSGYDSTGIVEPLPSFTSLITVSGIQNSYKNISIHSMFNAAMFFDRSKPVYNFSNRIIAYHLRPLGNVYFNGEEAGEKQYRLRYRSNEGEKDTLLGSYHVIARLFSPGSFREFPYDSYVNFELEGGMGGQGTGFHLDFDIPTPEKVTGEVKISGSRRRHDIRMDLHWNINSDREAFIEIIVGGTSSLNDGVVPIVKFKTRDDGFFRVPRSMMRSIPLDKHPALVFTFRRSAYKNVQHDKLPDNHIIAQSIHNIKIDVP